MVGIADPRIKTITQENPIDLIQPGDTMQGEVAYQGNGMYVLQLADLTKGWTFKKQLGGSLLCQARNDAEWIFED